MPEWITLLSLDFTASGHASFGLTIWLHRYTFSGLRILGYSVFPWSIVDDEVIHRLQTCPVKPITRCWPAGAYFGSPQTLAMSRAPGERQASTSALTNKLRSGRIYVKPCYLLLVLLVLVIFLVTSIRLFVEPFRSLIMNTGQQLHSIQIKMMRWRAWRSSEANV